MNEGAMIKLFINSENLSEKQIAEAVGLTEQQLQQLYTAQTVDQEMKERLEGYFHRDLFDGSLLAKYYDGGSAKEAINKTGE